jgi:hypothetical protein
MQTMTTKAAIWCKTSTALAYSAKIADLNQQLTNSGCELASNDCIFGDTDNNLEGLRTLVNSAIDSSFKVVFVSHDIVPKEQALYHTLINNLYNLGVSIILC